MAVKKGTTYPKKFPFTDTAVENIEPELETVVYHDTSKSANGLKLRVAPGGAKTFFIAGRIKGFKNSNKFTIGNAKNIRLRSAHQLAGEFHSYLAEGKDPRIAFDLEDQLNVSLQTAFIDMIKQKGILDHFKTERELKGKKIGNKYETTIFETLIEIEYKKSGVRASTINDYVKSMAYSSAELLKKPLKKITKMEIQKHHSELISRGKDVNDMGRAADKWGKRVHSVFIFAHSNYLDEHHNPQINHNPTLDIPWFQKGGQSASNKEAIRRDYLPSVWKGLEPLKIYNELEQKSKNHFSAYSMFKLQFLTGLRIGSAQETKWSQVNIENGVILYIDSDAELMKMAKEFVLPISSQAIELLLEIRKHQIENNIETEYLFPSATGKNFLTEPKEWMHRWNVFSDIPQWFTSHNLRYTFSTVGVRAGVNPWVIKRLMNHTQKESADITSGYFTGEIDILRKGAQAISDELMRLVGEKPTYNDAGSDFIPKDIIELAIDVAHERQSNVKSVIAEWARVGYWAENMTDSTSLKQLKMMAKSAVNNDGGIE